MYVVKFNFGIILKKFNIKNLILNLYNNESLNQFRAVCILNAGFNDKKINASLYSLKSF